MSSNTTKQSGDELLTPAQVEEWLKLPVKTLYRWRYLGTGPRALAVGRHLRYRRSDVEEWLESR